MHQNHTNYDTENGTPVAAGDRYWAHDLLRDFHYTRGLAGLLGKALLGDDLLLAGGDTIVKSGNNSATVGEVYGICKTTINVPNDAAGWQIPKSYKADEIYMVVRAVNKTIAIPNGSGTLRLRYKATNGAQRARLFAAGSYAYYQTDDAEVVANNNAAATTDLVIATYTGAGSNLVITPTKTKWQQRDKAITTAISAEATTRQNADTAEATARQTADTAEGQARFAADTALQAAINAKPDVDVGLLYLKVTTSDGSTSALNTTAQPYISGKVNVNGTVVDIPLTAVSTPSVAGLYYVTISSAGAVSTSSATPAWNGDKHGFYSSAVRYVLRFYYTGVDGNAYYNNKMILEREEDLMRRNESFITPNTWGGQINVLDLATNISDGTNYIDKANYPIVYKIELPCGAYSINIHGGKGGNGGMATYGNVGGAGANGEMKTIAITLLNKTEIFFFLGRDGENGFDAFVFDINNDNGVGGGGGGGSGTSSILMFNGVFYEARGGSGGGGGAGWGGGGGGAGGYGTAEDGNYTLAGLNNGTQGKGGSNFVGGDGGNSQDSTACAGGGGGGLLGQGKKGSGNGLYSAEDGSGLNGGSGGSSIKALGGTGFNNTTPDTLTQTILMRMTYAGGGGGGDDYATGSFKGRGGAGGGKNLKSPSLADKIQIYRFW